MAELLLLPAIYLGLIIGLYELFLIHQDENFRGSHWLIHGFQSTFFCMLFVFACMNVDFVLELIPGLSTIPIISSPLFFRIAIGIIALIKIQGASMVVRGGGLAARGMGEHFIHTFIVVALIVASAYIWQLIGPLVSGILPT